MSGVLSGLLPERLVFSHTLRMFFITLVLAAALNLIYRVISLFINRKRVLETLKDFPGPRPHWLFGNLKEMKLGDDGNLDLQVAWHAEHGPIMRLVMGFWCSISTASPNANSTITSTAEPKDPMIYNFLRPWIGDGLVVSKGKKWARNRRLLTPAFHFDILKPYVSIFSVSAQVMVNKWKQLVLEESSLDMFEHVSLMTLDSLLRCIFGVTKGDIQLQGRRNPYIEAVYTLSELAIQRFSFFPYHYDFIFYLSPSGYKFRRACDVVHKFSSDVIQDRMKLRQTEGSQAKKKYLDFLDMLLNAKDADGRGLTEEEIQHEADTFMFAGHDTTASGISWCLYNLARHPDYQQRCRDEVNGVLQDKNDISWEDMAMFPYLTQCIKESLRLHPPVPNIGRVTTQPLSFKDGRTVPAETLVGVSIYASQNSPEIWPNPEVYDPDRFDPANSKGRPSHAFIPFSAGPRNCIGQHFAMHELRTVIATVIRNFELTTDESKPVIRMPELILRSKGGLWLKAKPIELQ